MLDDNDNNLEVTPQSKGGQLAEVFTNNCLSWSGHGKYKPCQ